MTFDPGQPLRAVEAKKLVRQILKHGQVSFTTHALKELKKDDMTTVDVTNVLRAGACHDPEWENGAWRYSAETQRFRVIFELDTETHCMVVTAMRFRQ